MSLLKQFYKAAPQLPLLLLLGVSNEALAVDVAVLYEGENFTGASWSLPVGEYDITDFNASAIGNDALSSLTLTSGYGALVCRNGLTDEDNCDSFGASSSSLGSMNNDASSIKIYDLSEDATALILAFDTLMFHINGTDVLTTAELYELRDTISELTEGGISSGNTAVVQKGYDAIRGYEATYGALFTSGGTQSFSLADSDTDGHELERTIHTVYLAIFDAIDTSLLTSNYDLVDGLAFGSADYFPGAVAAPTDPDAAYEAQINASVPEDWGRPNLYSTLAARRPTGAYLAPGSIAEVIVPDALINSGFQIRVGNHSWDLSSKPSQKRIARATKLFPITSATTQVANPLGGNIYIEAPHLADAGLVTIQLKNTVRSPYFSARNIDQITASEWNNSERDQPAPWTDIETDKVMMSVPSKWIRDFGFAEMTEILDTYDIHMDAVSDYMGKPRIRNKTLLFMQVDVIFRGAAFYPGYPMSNYASFDSDTPKSPLSIDHASDQIMLHEHGHATLMTKFTTNERESLVHMLYPYIQTQLYDESLEESFSNSLGYAKSTERTMDDVFISWALRDEFLNDIDMGYPNASYKHRGHADHIQYAELFGWNALTEFHRKLNVDFVETGYDFSPNNHENNDRLLRLSREASADVRPLFHLWGHSPTDQNTLQASLDAENLGPSAEIYDLMVAYKPTIPFLQADYDAWYERMSAVLFSGHRTEFWDPLAASYDTDRAQAAVDRIDALIALYFADGRPEASEEPVVPEEPEEPQEPQVPETTPYGEDSDFDGVPDSIELAENTDPTSASSFQDTDSDGIPDYADADSDGDGTWNLFESGAFPYYDRDRDGIPAYLDDNDYNNQIGNGDNTVESLFDPDNNGIAQFREPVTDAIDTDNDGVPDNVETVNGTLATDATSFLDFDNDTIPDYLDEDDDNDGILDVIEGSSDADEDGIANQFDTDSDGDGTSDSEEGYADLNGDSLPNFLDPATTTLTAVPDQDSDGITDEVDGTDDPDKDNILNRSDTDSDNDGLSDLEETNADTDADGTPNYLDDDSDADGIDDAIEGMDDADNDAQGNAVDNDSDADMIPDSIELADDPDADGIPNYLDTDSDGDGIADLLETAGDSDGDGVPNYLDNDASDNDASDSDKSAPSLTTGSGCILSSGNGLIDPSLFILLMFSLALLWRRRKTM